MKILQINSCHYRRGGADVVYLNTGKLLENHGHIVYYFSQESSENLESTTSKYFIKETDYFDKSFLYKIYSVPRFFYSNEAKSQISKLVTELKPDVAHIHLYKGVLTPSILLELKKNKIPVVITLHDYGFLCPHNSMLDGQMNICDKCIQGTALNCIINKCNRNNLILSTVSSLEFIFQKTFFPFEKYFDRIIAVSKFAQTLHQKSGQFKRKIDHLYNFYPNIDKKELNSKKGTYFLYFGRLSPEKGLKTLFSAWLTKNRKSKLKVVGNGELFDELSQLASGNKSIEMLGYKTGLELIEIIREASFIIVSSECNENNPLTIIEAYSKGKPVIGSNTGGIPEIIDDGNTGYIFEMKSVEDLSDKIEMAESINEKEYARLSENSRSFAELHFSEETHYNALLGIYKELI
jgi:glycosyltransferase involved in cell wall biosynthesis